ncbi:sigma-70 family RNA polymerase sigma factor [Oscillatoria sp. CS-180]|uniref:RNA polymerase sigma factor n=1 Tax=Oscillatoria sp. CS-180 TaxID=3021720 RepID=UPI00232F2127|nr:sigma-70 family RNA polymerase sigma factor [Oscillatoria sp. CS-180]MDB9524511.1 sigma-70 family RNA polymerase sigma factor [Oscillatoria sp. CS-180]
MSHSGNSNDDREHRLPGFEEEQDCFDQAIESILGKENPAAYSVFTAIKRTIRQFKLDVEPHGLLFDAYLHGKKALQQGKEIRNPKAWLKGTAYNLAREKHRKRKKTYAYAPELMEVMFSDEDDSPMERAILEEEILAVFQAVHQLQEEKPDIYRLIHQRVVEELSWQEIQSIYTRENGGQDISEATLRQRFSRGRKYLRSIFHRVMTV